MKSLRELLRKMRRRMGKGHDPRIGALRPPPPREHDTDELHLASQKAQERFDERVALQPVVEQRVRTLRQINSRNNFAAMLRSAYRGEQ